MNNFILVTGSSSGIGAEIAKLLSNKYNIILHGSNIVKLKKIKKKCSSKYKQIIWEYDLSKINNIKISLEQLIRSNKIKINGYIHSAGKFLIKPSRLVTAQEIEEIWNIYFFSSFLIFQTIINKKINKSALKKVIFISSNISGRGSNGTVLYNSTKGALDSMMRSLAIEFAPNIKINSILPGAIETNMTKNIFYNKKIKNLILKNYPNGFGQTKDIANFVDFLISNNSNWVSGQQITIDGGRSIDLSE
jgi:NAD(P)-dependent dehydrogenase (short-subunit alcohol dehydrogenase family)